MKRNEKNEKSRAKILEAAIKEYGSKPHGETSINNICKENNISKGLIYHYFKNVDGLYIACVNECYTKLYEFLKENTLMESTDIQIKMRSYFEARSEFFKENPYFRNIFSVSMFQRPSHLDKEIEKCREKLNEFNCRIIRNFIDCLTLREGISKETAVTYFSLFNDVYNNSFNTGDMASESNDEKFEKHEKFILKAIDMVLYGIAER